MNQSNKLAKNIWPAAVTNDNRFPFSIGFYFCVASVLAEWFFCHHGSLISHLSRASGNTWDSQRAKEASGKNTWDSGVAGLSLIFQCAIWSGRSTILCQCLIWSSLFAVLPTAAAACELIFYQEAGSSSGNNLINKNLRRTWEQLDTY
jgi:hypothetical protein